MPEPSNPTSRVIDVLNFLAAHPMDSFSLADIARPLGLSNGSAHRILTTLAQAQFLSRNESQRTYSLGMAMIAIGEAAVQKHRGVEVARRELGRLAAELNMQCSASTVIDGELVVLVKEGVAQSHRGLTRVGERRPLLPPLGLCHVAWGGAAVIEDYVAKAAPHMADASLARLRAAFPIIRQRGYAIAANGAGSGQSREATVRPTGQVRDESYWASVFAMVGSLAPDEIQLVDPEAVGAEGVAFIAAPVFASDASVALQLVISGMSRAMDAKDVAHCAERLRATAAIVTSEIFGRSPVA